MKLGAASLSFCLCAAKLCTASDDPVAAQSESRLARVLTSSSSVIDRNQPYTPPSGDERVKIWLRRTVLSPMVPARAMWSAAFDQLAHDPEQWPLGAEGFARRAGHHWARSAVRNSIESGAAAAMGTEVRYIPCKCTGVFRRVGHAFAMNFITFDREGHWVPNVPRVGSTVAAEYISLTWLPDGARTMRQATRGFAVRFATGSLSNLWREFTPEVKRAFNRK